MIDQCMYRVIGVGRWRDSGAVYHRDKEVKIFEFRIEW